MLTIRSRSHDYHVEDYDSLRAALESVVRDKGVFFLIDGAVIRSHADAFIGLVSEEESIVIEASEAQKSFEKLTPVFLE